MLRLIEGGMGAVLEDATGDSDMFSAEDVTLEEGDTDDAIGDNWTMEEATMESSIIILPEGESAKYELV